MGNILTYTDFVLNETLKTHDIDLTIGNVSSELNLQRYNFKINKNFDNNTFVVVLIDFDKVQNFELYISNLNSLIVNRHGWFPSKMVLVNFSGMSNEFAYDEDIIIKQGKYLNNVSITYEAKFDIELDIPEYLYHLSIQEYESNILKSGIIPKSKSKLSNHLDRIYLCKSSDDCKSLIDRMKFHYYNKPLRSKINDKCIIYKIDTKNSNIKLYKDPNYKNGYYSISNIPKDNIVVDEREK